MLDVFLTSYDPSDLPGSSIDPLGFERGYLFLADKLLPGLTNVASRPRYFSLLCAGISLCRDDITLPIQRTLENRRETFLRLERFWALANVLARGPEEAGGVRGVSYARAVVDGLIRSKATKTDSQYKLLTRQIQYGGIGMYGVVADGMRFINRDSLSLTPDLGQPMAEAFIAETDMPPAIQKAVREDGEVSLTALREWGARAHVDGRVQADEGRFIGQALLSDPVRSRMAALLRRHPRSDGVDELERLRRIAASAKKERSDPDLEEAMRCIVAYESCFKLVSLAFERMLWTCKQSAATSSTIGVLASDPVIAHVTTKLREASDRFAATLAEPATEEFRRDLHRLDDVKQFLALAAATSTDAKALLSSIVSRHSEVQTAKFDRGRKKMPWLEANGDKLTLTITRVGGLRFEAASPADITPHPYRLGAADAMINASPPSSV